MEDSPLNRRKIKSKNNRVCPLPGCLFCAVSAKLRGSWSFCSTIYRLRQHCEKEKAEQWHLLLSAGWWGKISGWRGGRREGANGREARRVRATSALSPPAAAAAPSTVEPVGAASAVAGRTAPLPRPAAAQHRPAGGEARRAEPRAPGSAARFGALHQ